MGARDNRPSHRQEIESISCGLVGCGKGAERNARLNFAAPLLRVREIARVPTRANKQATRRDLQATLQTRPVLLGAAAAAAVTHPACCWRAAAGNETRAPLSLSLCLL